jgi:hypothetical protein
LLPSLQALQFQYIILILYNLDDYRVFQQLQSGREGGSAEERPRVGLLH